MELTVMLKPTAIIRFGIPEGESLMNFVNGVFRLKARALAHQRLAHQSQCVAKETSNTKKQERGCVQHGHSGKRSSCPTSDLRWV